MLVFCYNSNYAVTPTPSLHHSILIKHLTHISFSPCHIFLLIRSIYVRIEKCNMHFHVCCYMSFYSFHDIPLLCIWYRNRNVQLTHWFPIFLVKKYFLMKSLQNFQRKPYYVFKDILLWLKQIRKWALTPIDKPQAFVNKRYKNAWKSVWWDIEWVVVIVGFVLCILYVRGKYSCFVSIN